MNRNIYNRVLLEAKYIIDNNKTIRGTSNVFGVSKSTVHKDVSSRLQKINPSLYLDVKKVLEINKSERHIRGGIATRNKYLNLRKQKENT